MFSDRRRNSTPRWTVLGIITVILILGFMGMPRVTQVQPLPGAEFVPSTAPIQLTFNRPMDRVSVESRLRIDPPHPGHFQWDENEVRFVPDEPWEGGEIISVWLDAGARTSFFLPILRSRAWSFIIGLPRIMYLWPVGGGANLYARSDQNEGTTQLTDSPFGVLDFAVRAEAAEVIYTELREDGGSDFWILDLVTHESWLIYACPSEYRCQDPILSPNLEQVAFVRLTFREGPSGKKSLGSPQVWILAMGDEPRAFQVSPAGHEANSPLWSPNGWLAYYDGTSKEILVEDTSFPLQPVLQGTIPSDLGDVGTWSIDGESLIYPDLTILPEADSTDVRTEGEPPLYYSHILRRSVKFGLNEDLSGAQSMLVEDATPVVSPDGKWVAFARRNLEGEDWTPGRQVWIMRIDGSEAAQLTNSPMHNHIALAWSPDAASLAFARTNQNDLEAGPEIWRYDFSSKNSELVSKGGYLPQWIP